MTEKEKYIFEIKYAVFFYDSIKEYVKKGIQKLSYVQWDDISKTINEIGCEINNNTLSFNEDEIKEITTIRNELINLRNQFY